MLQFNYRKTPGVVAALIKGASFEPEAIAAMTAAYHAILKELRLSRSRGRWNAHGGEARYRSSNARRARSSEIGRCSARIVVSLNGRVAGSDDK
jgi:hypothetical protein